MDYFIKPELSAENIYKYISSYDIFRKYCKNFKQIGIHFNSEFREDENPSCCIDVINGDLYYKDFGNGEGYRSINYVMRKFNLNYYEALKLIDAEFKIGLTDGSTDLITDISTTNFSTDKDKHSILKEKPITVIKIKRRQWREKDLEYWVQYGWDIDMLSLHDIYPIDYFWIINHKGTRRFYVGSKRVYSIDYYRSKGIFRRKIYFVDKSTNRFISNVDNSIVQGYKLIPRSGGDLLFITSSIKDCGIFTKLGYHAVAPNNEGSFLPIPYYEKLRKRWKRIVIWYNNDWHKEDNPGVTSAKKYSEMFNIEYYYNPDNEPKDPSDYIKKYGITEGYNKFNILIKEKLKL
jgi:hypothetical protein